MLNQALDEFKNANGVFWSELKNNYERKKYRYMINF